MRDDISYGARGFISNWRTAWRFFRRDRLAMIGLYGFALLLILTSCGYLLSPYEHGRYFPNFPLMPPSWSHYGEISFFLGTDDLGQDVLSRLLQGATATIGCSLLITLAIVICTFLASFLLNLSCVKHTEWLSNLLDTLLSIPPTLFAIVMVALLGPSLLHTLFAVWSALMPRAIYALRRAIYQELNKEYVMAVRLDGANSTELLWQAIIPNILPLLIKETTNVLSMCILTIATLGFFDLGIGSFCEWGSMIGEALDLIQIAPWTLIAPGLGLFLSILIINLFGDGIRRAFTMEMK